jgi:uncharacterized protein with PQ loop repeat
MNIFEITYTIGVLVAIGACIPQVIQLIKTKRSDEFSISTWLLWATTQGLSFMYAMHLGDTLLIAANAIWVSFYTLMVALIFHYRAEQLRLQYEQTTD